MSPFTNRQPNKVAILSPSELLVVFSLGDNTDPLNDRQAVANEIAKYVQAYPTIRQVSTQYTGGMLIFNFQGSLNLSDTNPFL